MAWVQPGFEGFGGIGTRIGRPAARFSLPSS